MYLHGADADKKPLGDFSIRAAQSDLFDDFSFPRGEALGEFLSFRLATELWFRLPSSCTDRRPFQLLAPSLLT